MLSLQPLRVVTRDRDAFEDKKTKMAASHLSGSDVLKLNVRGTHFQTRRATLTQVIHFVLASPCVSLSKCDHPLCLPGVGNMCCYCFRQKALCWPLCLVGAGRNTSCRRWIFLDYIPYCFERIMDYLSSKAIEHPDRPVPQPAIRAGSEADFETLVSYLGLQQYMGYNRLSDSVPEHQKPYFYFDNFVGLSPKTNGKIFTVGAPRGYDEMICFTSPPMAIGQVHHLRCQVLSLKANRWLFLGVTQAATARVNAETDPTSFGWCTLSQYVSGKQDSKASTSQGWSSWRSGDKLLFKVDLESKFLHVSCDRFSHAFSLPIISGSPDPFRFHVSSGHDAGASIQLLPGPRES